MEYCPITELLVVLDSGLPLITWNNPFKDSKSITSEDKRDLISGLFTAILTISEDISGGQSPVKEINMAQTVFKYKHHENLIFILGYETSFSKKNEDIITKFLTDLIDMFDSRYHTLLQKNSILDEDQFADFHDYLEKEVKNDQRWHIEQSIDEILSGIEDLLLNTLGPIATEIFQTCLKKQKKYHSRRKGNEINLQQLASDLEYDISMFMDITQARQIGFEINNIIRGLVTLNA